MRGNNFLSIGFGARQKQIPIPNKNNRRAIHYSYNLVNNYTSMEEDLITKDKSGQKVLPKESSNSFVKSHATSTAREYEFYGKSLLAKRPGGTERKLSLQLSKDVNGQRNSLRGTDSKTQEESDKTPLSLLRERKSSLNYANKIAKKSSQHDLNQYSVSRSDRSSRYSDPFYEQRSLPPIPFRNPNNSQTSTVNVANSADKVDNLKITQFSKSQNNLSTSGLVARKDGISAVENKDIMHAKMRKRGVCDQTDDSHYQRQFLRVLNKRF